MNFAEMTNRINKLEAKVEASNKIVRELGEKFAWYWYRENQRVFAIIGRLNKDRADLISFTSNWSGGFAIIEDSPMFIEDPTVPLDEQPKEGKWEPLVDLEDILDAAISAEALSGQTSATAPDTEAA